MLKSLYSGVSGLSANQTKLDVIGNNIANVGTTAFKGSRVRFEDELSQTIKDATVPTTDQGGANEAQVGLGVKLAGIDTMMNQGSIQSTGRSLDAAIDGEGYFVVSNGPTVFTDNSINVNQSAGQHTVNENSLSKTGTSLMYTRDGSFTLDKQGNLLSSDGLRIMGYSLTNDNSTTLPTASEPNPVLAGGFSFQFGPGEALNGYTVVLGTIGEGTLTSASVDTTNKKIILNGDFSDAGKISTSAAEKAINDALSTSGIAQTVSIGGAANPVYGTTSDLVSGGINAVAADSVSAGGFNFAFNAGSQLNGYTIKFGTIAAGTATSANVNTTSKVITLNADLTTLGAVRSSDIQTVLQTALQTVQITTPSLAGSSITVSGSPVNISASDAVSTNGTVTYRGMNFSFIDGSGNPQLSGYKIQLGTIIGGTATSASINNTTKIITVNGDINSMTAYDYQTALQTAIKQSNLSSTLGNATVSNATVDSTGKALFGNFNINFTNTSTTPATAALSGYTIQRGATTGAASASVSGTTITISGTAANLGNLTGAGLQSLIQGAAGLPANTTVTVSNNVITNVSGTPTSLSNIASNLIDGGVKAKNADTVNSSGFNFAFGPGEELNGYKIKIGTISQGTQLSTDIDTTNRTITINGDFVTANAVGADQLTAVLNNALSKKSITQSVTATGSALTIPGTTSSQVSGGTPLESIGSDGVIDFVDGSKPLYSYDASLKTLRIPDSVHDDATNTDYKVKSFSIGTTGIITATLENGKVAALGQIAMANFSNAAGLTKAGNNTYTSSITSGVAVFKSGVGTKGEDNSALYGDVKSSSLEASNVDLAQQFTDMIVASRAFQANGKTISTGDEILQDIINLKR